MADIEKVKQGLRYHASYRCDDDQKGLCPYWGNHCSQQLCKDAISVIEEQQKEIERLKPKKGQWDYGTQCSVCKGTIIPPKDRKVHINFCPWCGADIRDQYE